MYAHRLIREVMNIIHKDTNIIRKRATKHIRACMVLGTMYTIVLYEVKRSDRKKNKEIRWVNLYTICTYIHDNIIHDEV